MALLSHDLARIILSYDTFGSHLDEQLKTADDKLEKYNFKVAEENLASVRKNIVIDGFQNTDHLVHPIVVVHNYQYGEFLVSNDKGEAMWIEEDTIPED
ncbi:18837_t:CDS:2, partial [Gigaspora margarita]